MMSALLRTVLSVESYLKIMPSQDQELFSSLSLRPELQTALKAASYVHLTPIQSNTASSILANRDVLAQAETGSGKTAAFSLAILNKLDSTVFKTQALVICPTRELSDQVAVELRRLASGLPNTRVVTLCGGKPMHDQLTSLKRAPQVVVGTPGRLKKHVEKATLDISDIDTLVLDEADRMLDMGFHDDIMSLLDITPTSKQTLLFSATYPEEIVEISQAIQKDPQEVRVEGSNAVEQIRQVFIKVPDANKSEMLLRGLGQYNPDNAIIFCNRKKDVQAICDLLKKQGISARALHGDLDQRERDEAVLLFANKSITYLVATDVAARGLDISALSAVINYDVTPDPETHLHRIGRTGRAGMDGIAITFIEPHELHRVEAIEDYLQSQVRFKDLPKGNSEQGRLKMSFVAVDMSKATLALSILSEGKIKRRKFRVSLMA